MAQSSGTTADLGKVVLPNNLEFNFFPQLKRNVGYEQITYDKRPLTIPKKAPYQQADKDLMAFNQLYHTDDVILSKIPYEQNKSRMLLDYYDGRNLNLLDNLKKNAKTAYPTSYFDGRQVLGRIL